MTSHLSVFPSYTVVGNGYLWSVMS